MHRKLITTANFRAADRYEAWATICNDLGIGTSPPKDPRIPYRGEIKIVTSEALSLLAFDSENCPVYRLAPQINRLAWGQYWIYRECGPGAWFKMGDREFITSAGDLVVADADAPFETIAKNKYRHQIWMLPRGTLDPHLPKVTRPFILHIQVGSEINRFLSAYLGAVGDVLAKMTDPLPMMAADHIARLIAVTAGKNAAEYKDTVKVAKLTQAKAFIEQNLSNPTLGPEVVAASLGISVRQVHLCFEPSGESFGGYVRRRRLEECHAMLTSPLSIQRSVVEVAFCWGFSSMPTFYRAFQHKYGVAPLDIRGAAMEKIMARNSRRHGRL